MIKRTPVRRLSFGQLDVILRDDADGGKTYGIYTNFDLHGLPARPFFSGVIEASTGTELRRIAGEMDIILKGGS